MKEDKIRVGLIAYVIKAALSGASDKKLMSLPTIGAPTAFPAPRKNHVRGMRRKAKIEGRRFFTVSRKRRKV